MQNKYEIVSLTQFNITIMIWGGTKVQLQETLMRA